MRRSLVQWISIPRDLSRALLLAILTLTTPAHGLDATDTRHLLDRTGFGVRPADLAEFSTLTRSEAVARQLRAPTHHQSAPDWAGQRPFPDRKAGSTLSETEQRARSESFRKERREQGIQLKSWWYRLMLTSDSPLTERMTLFWHNHFTSQLQAVRSPQLMWRQNELLRQHALGNYADLLRAIVTDSAMLVYLDGRRNNQRQPNENFARELLELFTLGEGHYTEADVAAAARALTGWVLDPETGKAEFRKPRHDAGEKTFLGRTGRWGSDDIITILLEQPRTAEFIVEKLWREFVSPRPDPAEVKRLAGVFRQADYAMRPLLRELLQSDAFWSVENRGTLIKSPAELIVGTLYRFELSLPPDRQLVSLGKQLGQDLLDPSDVKGWPGHTTWIDADRLLARERFLRRIVRDLEDESAQTGRPWGELNRSTLLVLLWPVAGGDVDRVIEGEGVRQRLIGAILDPRYQLK